MIRRKNVKGKNIKNKFVLLHKSETKREIFVADEDSKNIFEVHYGLES